VEYNSGARRERVDGTIDKRCYKKDNLDDSNLFERAATTEQGDLKEVGYTFTISSLFNRCYERLISAYLGKDLAFS
jgi:hypothetical protein